MLEPRSDSNDSKMQWRFWVDGDSLKFAIAVTGSVSVDFAKQALQDAIARKDKAILMGDGMSLDLILGGLTKEAINDFGRALNSQAEID